MVKGKNNKKIITILLVIICLIFSIFVAGSIKYQDKKVINNNYLSYDINNYLYLSDIKSNNNINLDKNKDGKLLNLIIDNNKKVFIKGLSFNNTEEIVYDLSNLQYDYFTSYIGLDSNNSNSNNITTSIYTSLDNINYEKVYEYQELNKSIFVKIDIHDIKYLKISVTLDEDNTEVYYADAKLVKEGYVKEELNTTDIIKNINEYDNLIKAYQDDINNNFSNFNNYQFLILQRNLVKNIGYNEIEALINYDNEYQEFLNYLLNNQDILELFLMGGMPQENYLTSIEILKDLFKNNEEDINDINNIKLMIAISLSSNLNTDYHNLYNTNKQYIDGYANLSVSEIRLAINNNGTPKVVVKNDEISSYLVLDSNRLWHINDKLNISDLRTKGYILNNWGYGKYASKNQASYLLLSIDALKDYDNFVKVNELIMLLDTYKDNKDLINKINNYALNIQSINLDIWLNLINECNDDNCLVSLGNMIVEKLANYPLPMYDLINLITNKMTNYSLIASLNNTLNLTLNNNINNDNKMIKDVVISLLNNNLDIVNFSFDGDNKNKLILNNKYQDKNIIWQYNLTGLDSDWHEVNTNEVELSLDEINLINEDNDIKIRFNDNLDDIFVIDIKGSQLPNDLVINDYENKIYGDLSYLEWQDENNNWISFNDKLPLLDNERVITIRVRKHETYLESEVSSLIFTQDNVKEEETYISLDNLSILSFSSEDEINKAQNIIDGNPNTYWQTSEDDLDKYIVIKLNEAKYLSGLSINSNSISNVSVFTSIDNVNWINVTNEVSLENKINFDQIELALYVKIIGIDNGSVLNLFEDKTRTSIPTASLEYSITSLTNQNVIVKLVNPSKEIRILNNNGSDTYTFSENGTFTYEFEDLYGNKNNVTAVVDYIDKELPIASLEFSTIAKTKDSVIVTLNSNEEIIILNNNGSNVYTFNENGTFIFEFTDLAGNYNTITANVTWINKNTDVKEETPKDNDNNYEEEIPIIPNNDKEDNNNQIVEEEHKEINWDLILFLIIVGAFIIGIIIVKLFSHKKEENLDILKDDDKLFKENKKEDLKAKKNTEVFEENTKELFAKEEIVDVLERKKTASFEAKKDNLLKSNNNKRNNKKKGSNKNKKAS